MRQALLFGIVLFLGIGFSACQEDENTPLSDKNALDTNLDNLLVEVSDGAGKDFFKLPEQGYYDEIPQDPKNPITSEKVKLGRLLYHETALGLAPMQEIGKGTFSCASCHFAEAGFQAGRWQGIADGGIGFGINREKSNMYEEIMLDVQAIRTPTVLNTAYQEAMLWNGQFGATGPNEGTEASWTEDTPKENNFLGYQGVETQAIAGLTVHRIEMDMDMLKELGYVPLFDQAFPDISTSERYSLEFAGLAIAAYERTVLSNRAPFQWWLRGDHDAMTDIQKEGAILFFGKAGCAECHTGPALNEMDFHAYGMNDLFECPEPVFKSESTSVENLGRGGFTGNAEDMYKFKVPQLYNLKDSPFIGHGSSMRSVKEVVEYKNEAIAENPNVPASQLATAFQPLELNEYEIDAITDFIENALYDPYLKRYEPDAVHSGNCIPNNDEASRVELGCE